MIKFKANLKVEAMEDKSIPKRDGEMFDFTEVVLSSGGKYPTHIVARLQNETQKELLQTGKSYPLELGITSYTRQDGRIWNNFIVCAVEVETYDDSQPVELESDDIPF